MNKKALIAFLLFFVFLGVFAFATRCSDEKKEKKEKAKTESIETQLENEYEASMSDDDSNEDSKTTNVTPGEKGTLQKNYSDKVDPETGEPYDIRYQEERVDNTVKKKKKIKFLDEKNIPEELHNYVPEIKEACEEFTESSADIQFLKASMKDYVYVVYFMTPDQNANAVYECLVLVQDSKATIACYFVGDETGERGDEEYMKYEDVLKKSGIANEK